MVPMGGIEPPTSPLPRECSTPELHGPIYYHFITYSYNPYQIVAMSKIYLERVKGIEPSP